MRYRSKAAALAALAAVAGCSDGGTNPGGGTGGDETAARFEQLVVAVALLPDQWARQRAEPAQIGEPEDEPAQSQQADAEPTPHGSLPLTP